MSSKPTAVATIYSISAGTRNAQTHHQQSVENHNYLQEASNNAKPTTSPQLSPRPEGSTPALTPSGAAGGPPATRLTPAPPASGISGSSSPGLAGPLFSGVSQIPQRVLGPVTHDRNNNTIINLPPAKQTAMDRTQQQINEVTGVMRHNLDAVIDRGDKLGDLDERADHLALNSERFVLTTKKLKNKYWWKNTKTCICLSTSGMILLALVVLLVVWQAGMFDTRPSSAPVAGAPGAGSGALPVTGWSRY